MKTKIVTISALVAGFLSVTAFADDAQMQMNDQMNNQMNGQTGQQQPAAPIEPAMPSTANAQTQQGATPDVAPPGNSDDMNVPAAPQAPAAPAQGNNY